eukprot:936675-Pelagomonas_calceolata.AAC.9
MLGGKDLKALADKGSHAGRASSTGAQHSGKQRLKLNNIVCLLQKAVVDCNGAVLLSACSALVGCASNIVININQ